MQTSWPLVSADPQGPLHLLPGVSILLSWAIHSVVPGRPSSLEHFVGAAGAEGASPGRPMSEAGPAPVEQGLPHTLTCQGWPVSADTAPSPVPRTAPDESRMAWNALPKQGWVGPMDPSIHPGPGPHREGLGRLWSAVEQKPWWEVGDWTRGGRWSWAQAEPAGVQTAVGGGKQVVKFQVVLSRCFP